MKWFSFLIFFFTTSVFAHIEDNSFLLEEAYNQEKGVYQFIQKFQQFSSGDQYRYLFENEIPMPDESQQFSIAIGYNQFVDNNNGVGDTVLSYRIQPLNKDGFYLADRFSLIVPTGSVDNNTGFGAYGVEFFQAATLTLSPQWVNHWNFGVRTIPHAKIEGVDGDATLNFATFGTSIIYLAQDNFNILLEGLLVTEQTLTQNERKQSNSAFIINPGVRFAYKANWHQAWIVPGISFPVNMVDGETDHGFLVYLSIEPDLN